MVTPTIDYQRTLLNTTEPPLSGLDAAVYGRIGLLKQRGSVLKEILSKAALVAEESRRWQGVSTEELQQELRRHKETLRRNGRDAEGHTLKALAVMTEVAERCLGLRPFAVQIAGALTMYEGYVAEMATGEGKTLTAGLAGVLFGWSGRPVHIITVNDYLAERDAEWLRPLYSYCGLTVGHVTGTMPPAERKAGYHCAITYTTSKELVADFLRDRLWLGDLQKYGRRQIRTVLGQRHRIEKGLVMRGIHTAIVDEADSVLIDEAVTPLIISQKSTNDSFIEACHSAVRIAGTLKEGAHYTLDHKYRDIVMLPAGEDAVRHVSNNGEKLFGNVRGRVSLIKQAVLAREFYQRGKQYVIEEDKIVIVDEFTGRLMPQRTWQAGLHQIIEAKEGVPVTTPSETLARLSFQRFYRFFGRLAGMTGTARESSAELWNIYSLPTLRVPENKPCQRVLNRRRIFPDQESKWQAIVEEITDVHNSGRPVLIGTRSVQSSEHLAKLLEQRGFAFRLLNAVHHKEEARIVAHAGEASAITVATNMAGRGTDIKLSPGVPERGGLHVIATECHETKRIDRQLFGRAARQGDPGSASAFVSLDDELIVRHTPAWLRKFLRGLLAKGLKRHQALAEQIVSNVQSAAQHSGRKKRKGVLQTDTWLEDSLSFAATDPMS